MVASIVRFNLFLVRVSFSCHRIVAFGSVLCRQVADRAVFWVLALSGMLLAPVTEPVAGFYFGFQRAKWKGASFCF